MGNVTWPVGIVLLTGLLWVVGAVLHWYTIRRQEKLIAQLRRAPARRRPRPAAMVEAGPPPEQLAPMAEYLRPSKRWTLG